MTNQLQGEILYEGWAGGAASTDWATTPWMPVRGDFATFGVEVTSINGVTMTWEAQTRTIEDPTAETTIVPGTAVSAVGVSVALSTTRAKQLVRYRFKTGSTSSTTNYIVFRALQPSWQGDR